MLLSAIKRTCAQSSVCNQTTTDKQLPAQQGDNHCMICISALISRQNTIAEWEDKSQTKKNKTTKIHNNHHWTIATEQGEKVWNNIRLKKKVSCGQKYSGLEASEDIEMINKYNSLISENNELSGRYHSLIGEDREVSDKYHSLIGLAWFVMDNLDSVIHPCFSSRWSCFLIHT